ncbi:3',5'-cyclic-AMP phosphodiesterase [Nitratiruptor sp. YY08-13]|nr:3',5'-cyclic-AMP phosphodiesterase [Nitratiruptor sp. YY08-13]
MLPKKEAAMQRRDFLKATLTLPLAFPLFAKEDEKLRFLHITDSHMDLSMPHTVKAMEHLADVVNTRFSHIDFVLFGGDNFNNTAPSDKDAKIFKAFLEKMKVPCYCVRGNKESSPKGDNSIDAGEFARLFFDQKGMRVSGRDWMVEHKGYLILGLDSTIEHSGAGIYTKETITFAKKALSKGKPTIILNHHPYLNYWHGTDPKDIHKYVLQNTKEVQEQLFRYPNLILTLSGHKHIDNVSRIGHVTAIASRAFKAAQILYQNPMRYIEIGRGGIKEKLITT